MHIFFNNIVLNFALNFFPVSQSIEVKWSKSRPLWFPNLFQLTINWLFYHISSWIHSWHGLQFLKINPKTFYLQNLQNVKGIFQRNIFSVSHQHVALLIFQNSEALVSYKEIHDDFSHVFLLLACFLAGFLLLPLTNKSEFL